MARVSAQTSILVDGVLCCAGQMSGTIHRKVLTTDGENDDESGEEAETESVQVGDHLQVGCVMVLRQVSFHRWGASWC